MPSNAMRLPCADHHHGCDGATVMTAGVEPRIPIEDWRLQVERWRIESPGMLSLEQWDDHLHALDEMEKLAGTGLEADAASLEVLRTQFMKTMQTDMQRSVDEQLQLVLALAAQYRALPGSTPSAG